MIPEWDKKKKMKNHSASGARGAPVEAAAQKPEWTPGLSALEVCSRRRGEGGKYLARPLQSRTESAKAGSNGKWDALEQRGPASHGHGGQKNATPTVLEASEIFHNYRQSETEKETWATAAEAADRKIHALIRLTQFP